MTAKQIIKILAAAAATLTMSACGFNPEFRASQVEKINDNYLLGLVSGCSIAGSAPKLFDDTALYQQELKNRRLLTEEQMATIYCGKLQIGMTKNEVIAAHGSPDNVNLSGGEGGNLEQWVYRDKYKGNKYLYFTGATLKRWQY